MLRAGVFGTTAAAFVYVWRIEPHWIEVTHHDLPIEAATSRWHGRRIVQISDVHIGDIVSDGYLARAFERVRDLRADTLVITGDSMTCLDTEHVEHAARVLSPLRRAARHCVLILGNHDYGEGWSRTHVGDAFAHSMSREGFLVLRNRAVDIDGLVVLGLDDVLGPRFDPGVVRRNVRPGEPTLVLCHNPDALDLAIWGEHRGWVLSGHTHGGQVRLPGIGALVLPVVNRRYAAGRIDVAPGRTVYVNRALGYHRRVRLATRPEITVFTVRAV